MLTFSSTKLVLLVSSLPAMRILVDAEIFFYQTGLVGFVSPGDEMHIHTYRYFIGHYLVYVVGDVHSHLLRYQLCFAVISF